MPGRHHVGFEYALRIDSPPVKVLAAFFDPRALAHWWGVTHAVATPRPLGVYAVEWAPSPDTDEVLGRLGGVFHGSVIDYQPGRGFFVADCYWLPPEGEPVGPMALEVTCSPEPARGGGPGAHRATMLRVVQRGLDEDSPRWTRYYEVVASGWTRALDTLKVYLEKGRGIWDLRSYD